MQLLHTAVIVGAVLGLGRIRTIQTLRFSSPTESSFIAGKHRSHSRSDAVCYTEALRFAGKPRSNGRLGRLLEPSLPAMNDDAMRLACRVPCVRCLPAKTNDAMRLASRVPCGSGACPR